jgi:hypothetical protein
MIAKLGQGLARKQTARNLASAPSTVVRTACRFAGYGEESLLDQRASNVITKVDARLEGPLEQLRPFVATEFGWQRTTWTRELLGRELERRSLPRVAPCRIGRALSDSGSRLGMPKRAAACPRESAPWIPIPRCPRRPARITTIDELVFFEDDADVHLNPTVGRDWMPWGQRRNVRTSGQNPKCFVNGVLNAATWHQNWVDAPSRAIALFHKLVRRIAGEYSHARRTHLFLDIRIIHSSKGTKRFLARSDDRAAFHFCLPSRQVDKRIERVWLGLHAQATRYHCCLTIEELMVQVVPSFEPTTCKRSSPPHPSSRPVLPDRVRPLGASDP